MADMTMASDFLKFLGWLWNALLLTQSLNWVVDSDLETCKERLSGLAQPQTGSLFNRHRTDAKILIQSEIAYNFQIDAKRYGRAMDYSSALAVGTLSAAQSTNQTHVHLKIRMGLFFLPILAVPIGIFLSFNLTEFARTPVFYVFVLAATLFYIRYFVTDYNNLLKRIQESLKDSEVVNLLDESRKLSRN